MAIPRSLLALSLLTACSQPVSGAPDAGGSIDSGTAHDSGGNIDSGDREAPDSR